MKSHNDRGGVKTIPRKSARPRRLGSGVLVLGAVCLIVGGVLTWLATTSSALMSSGMASAAGAPAIGGPFHMIDQNGRRVDESILKGRWSVVFFGYVSCPDICPATMQSLAVAKSKMGSKAKDLQIIFVSIDPARDTPAQLRAWLDQPGFPKPVTALTGTPAEVAAIAKAYKVFYKKEEGVAKDYQMAHSAAIYLMNPQGRFTEPMTYQDGPDRLAAQLTAGMH